MASFKTKSSDYLAQIAIGGAGESPFTDDIMTKDPPEKYTIPKFVTYNGTADPVDHLFHYRKVMTLHEHLDYLMCRVFPSSLHGPALTWFHKIPSKTISNFPQLCKLFIAQYSCNRKQIKDIDSLFNLKKSESYKKASTFESENKEIKVDKIEK